DRAGAALCHCRPMDTSPGRSGRGVRLGLDADQGARAPARRRAAARDLRSCRLAPTDDDDRGDRSRRDLGHPRARRGHRARRDAVGRPRSRAEAARAGGRAGMIQFAELLDRLAYAPARNTKLWLMAKYFRATSDPDRGWALAVLTDGLPFSFPVRRTLQELIEPRFDAELFRLSYD